MATPMWRCCLYLMAAVAPSVGQTLNRAPHFLPGGDMARFSLSEDARVGSPVYRLRGLDPEGSLVHYSISGEHLTVDRASGVVTLLREVDREMVDILEVIISITDEGIAGSEPNTVSLRREVPILDVNDNPPRFHGRPYSFSVHETTPVGTPLYANISLTDADGGVNSDLALDCGTDGEADDTCQAFSVEAEKVGEGRYVGIISLERPLDYERRSAYSLVLRATDLASDKSWRLTATAHVSIDVMDVQDQPPMFLNAPYSATVPEAMPQGTSVLRVRAKDGDMGRPRPVVLSLEDDYLGYFTLLEEETGDSTTSALLVTGSVPLDREHPDILQSGGIYTFHIRASELMDDELTDDSSLSQVTIVVTDVDDQGPSFNKDNFHINVSEDIGVDTPLPGLTLVAHDRDVGENSRYSLSLRDISNSRGKFTVHPSQSSGRTPVVVKVARPLDYDVTNPGLRTMVFDIVASIPDEEEGDIEVAGTRVTVELLDANDNAPEFPTASQRVRVLEDAPPGTSVLNLTARDRDSGELGAVTYSIRGFGSAMFGTHRTKGGLHVLQDLDYEKQKSYSLTLEAQDGGGRVATANLFVEVADVNDNSPVFEQREYSRTIREGATTFQPQLYVRATDVDGPEQGGGKIFYSLAETNAQDVLFVEPVSGEVKLNSKAKAADTARGQYELLVQATDAGEPPLSAETRVLVRVGVPGNQRPIFRGNHNSGLGPASYTASVEETAPGGTDVVQVSATDPDGQDSLLLYSIAAGARDNFVIGSKSGLITVSPDARLDRETSGHEYVLVVNAVDAGTPIRETATATVNVQVLDVNDKPPVFSNKDNYVRYVSERAPIGESVLFVTAVDPDSDSELQYSLVEPIRAADRTGAALKTSAAYNLKAILKVNSTTGEVTVAGPLDHQAAAVVIVTVEARDTKARENVALQVATTEVTVYIQAHTDTTPLFGNPGWTPLHPVIRVKVPEEQPQGTLLLTLNAMDPLDGTPISNYQGLEGARGLVILGARTGQVLLDRRLDYEALVNKTLSFKVRATAGDKSRWGDATVVLEVQDINDNSPEFSQQSYESQVPESARPSQAVLTVKARDLDSTEGPGYGSLHYSLSGEHAAMFSVGADTGIVTVAAEAALDRERQGMLRFVVVAADTPQGGSEQRKASAQITVEVLDVNDNAPVFGRPHYSAVVPENVDTATPVATVVATDPDQGQGGQVNYEFSNEGEASGLFLINQTTGEIKTRRPLTGKGREEPYLLSVRAQDGGEIPLWSDVPLKVYIGDVFANDGVPLFIRPTLDEVAQISENSTLGSPVFQVRATDPDDPGSPNGKIQFKFVADGADTRPFAIDERTGLITTRSLLDREQQDFYQLIVVVQDKGDPPQQATRVLRVNITDIDDHKPLFIRGLDDDPLLLTVTEESSIGTEVGEVQADDKDIGSNGMIDYLITYGNEDGLFSIDRTDDNVGMIKVAKRVDRETESEHLLTVKCFKMATRPQSLRKSYNRQDPSERQVRIKVEDIDDNMPQFSKDNITIGVRLNVPVDTALLSLEASDVDADAGPISYRLVNTTFTTLAPSMMDSVPVTANHSSVFRLDQESGELRTAGSLLGYVDGFFKLDVKAENTGVAGRAANSTIKVFVVRDRDLLKFVFGKPPGDVRRNLAEFRRQVELALLLPVTLNVYDTQFYAKQDGSLDFSSTSSCFQLVGRENYDLGDVESLLRDPTNRELNRVYSEFGVQSVQRCAPVIAKAEASWTQLWVLAIAGFIGLAALIAAITVCCLYGRYKHHSKAAMRGPPRFITGPPPGLMVAEGPRMYEWPHDATSYHGFPS